MGQHLRLLGYATEACQPIIQYAFTELKLKRIVNSVLQKNSNSINLMKRLGFRIETNLHPEDAGVVGILENVDMPCMNIKEVIACYVTSDDLLIDKPNKSGTKEQKARPVPA